MGQCLVFSHYIYTYFWSRTVPVPTLLYTWKKIYFNLIFAEIFIQKTDSKLCPTQMSTLGK